MVAFTMLVLYVMERRESRTPVVDVVPAADFPLDVAFSVVHRRGPPAEIARAELVFPFQRREVLIGSPRDATALPGVNDFTIIASEMPIVRDSAGEPLDLRRQWAVAFPCTFCNERTCAGLPDAWSQRATVEVGRSAVCAPSHSLAEMRRITWNLPVPDALLVIYPEGGEPRYFPVGDHLAKVLWGR
jgi:hypothetical protein